MPTGMDAFSATLEELQDADLVDLPFFDVQRQLLGQVIQHELHVLRIDAQHGRLGRLAAAEALDRDDLGPARRVARGLLGAGSRAHGNLPGRG